MGPIGGRRLGSSYIYCTSENQPLGLHKKCGTVGSLLFHILQQTSLQNMWPNPRSRILTNNNCRLMVYIETANLPATSIILVIKTDGCQRPEWLVCCPPTVTFFLYLWGLLKLFGCHLDASTLTASLLYSAQCSHDNHTWILDEFNASKRLVYQKIQWEQDQHPHLQWGTAHCGYPAEKRDSLPNKCWEEGPKLGGQ